MLISDDKFTLIIRYTNDGIYFINTLETKPNIYESLYYDSFPLWYYKFSILCIIFHSISGIT